MKTGENPSCSVRKVNDSKGYRKSKKLFHRATTVSRHNDHILSVLFKLKKNSSPPFYVHRPCAHLKQKCCHRRAADFIWYELHTSHLLYHVKGMHPMTSGGTGANCCIQTCQGSWFRTTSATTSASGDLFVLRPTCFGDLLSPAIDFILYYIYNYMGYSPG